MANSRNYIKDADDTLTGVTPSDYETGKGANARLRKINLNVDIATQAELNEAFNLLSTAIQEISTGTLTNYYTKPEANEISTTLSTALTGEINAEATAREEADNAIKASLSAYALSTTVADAYVVTVEKQDTAETGYAATYVVKQGGTALTPKINIPKDFLVKSAELCTVTVADQPYAGAKIGDKYIDFVVNTEDQLETAKHVYLPVNDLVDVYTGGATAFANVNVDDNRVITVNVSADTISAAAVAAVVGTSSDVSSANTIYGAKKYADEVAAAVAVSAEGETGDDALVTADDANNMITVGSTQKLKDAVTAAETAIQSVAGDNTYLTASTANKAVTISATDKLTAVVDKVEQTSATWDAAAPLTALTAETQRATDAETALGTRIDNLSATYASKTTVDDAATTLEAAAAITAKDLTAYNDIDEIITELEALKAAVKTFAGTLKTA